MSTVVTFTDEAPGRLPGVEVTIIAVEPTIEELIQLTSALSLDVPEFNRLVRSNAAVRMVVGLFLSLRRTGRHVTARDVLSLVPEKHFTAASDGEGGEVEPDPPTARTTDTDSVPDGSGRHAVTPNPPPA